MRRSTLARIARATLLVLGVPAALTAAQALAAAPAYATPDPSSTVVPIGASGFQLSWSGTTGLESVAQVFQKQVASLAWAGVAQVVSAVATTIRAASSTASLRPDSMIRALIDVLPVNE